MLTRIALITVSVSALSFLMIFSFVLYPVSAQTMSGSSKNMTSVMMDLARIHLKAADKALMNGNTTGALTTEFGATTVSDDEYESYGYYE